MSMMVNEKRLIDTNAKFIEEHFARQMIDKDALIDVIENIDWYHISPQGKLAEGANTQRNTPLYKAADIHRALANAPIVDAVEVKHGRWELHGNDDDCGCSYFCSNCHESYDEDWFYVHGQHRHWNYCPNCGAKKDGGEKYA